MTINKEFKNDLIFLIIAISFIAMISLLIGAFCDDNTIQQLSKLNH